MEPCSLNNGALSAYVKYVLKAYIPFVLDTNQLQAPPAGGRGAVELWRAYLRTLPLFRPAWIIVPSASLNCVRLFPVTEERNATLPLSPRRRLPQLFPPVT